MDTKRIVALVASVVFVLIFGFTLTWTILNFDKVSQGMSGTGLYTREDIDTSYQDGYDTALVNKAEYEVLIAQYREKLTEFEDIKKELTTAKYKIADLESTVAKLQSYIADCEQMIKVLTAENFMLTSQVRTLEDIRANLMQSVNAYIQLIASISLINERFVVTFMFDDTVYSIVLVPDKEKVSIISPVSNEYTIFLGWSLSQDGELIDLENLEITADTVIYAKIIRKYDVNFVLDYKIHQHRIVEKGQTITAPSAPSTPRRMFRGWSLDGVNIINVANYEIWEHRTFFAVVEERYEVRFVVSRTSPYQIINLSTQYVGALSNVSVPNTPSYPGYSFNGWLLNGLSVVDPLSYVVTSDTVFVARYTNPTITINNTYRFGSNNMFAAYNILSYLSNNGHGYVNNMQMLKTFNVVVRVFAGYHNGATYTLSQNNYSIYRVACWGISEWYANGTLFYSVGLMANGFLQLQLTFEGSSLLNNTVFSGCTLEIVSMSFTLNDF